MNPDGASQILEPKKMKAAELKAALTAHGLSTTGKKVDHVMLLGDNFYGSGIHGDDTSCRFKKTFEDIQR